MTNSPRSLSNDRGGESSAALQDGHPRDTSTDRAEPIKLSGGWTGLVLTARPPGATTGFGHGRLPQVADWESLLTRLLDDPTAMPDYEVLKHSDAREVFRTRFQWKDNFLNVVCKRSRTRGFWRGLAARWRESRERTDFERGLDLLGRGTSTALPLAVIERTSPVHETLLITEFLIGAVDLDQVVLTQLPRLAPGRSHAVKNAIGKAVVDLFVGLQRQGFHHRDLKASNVLLTNWESRGEPVNVWLVDLEGLQPPGSANEQNRWQPLVRLAASLLDYISLTRNDYCRFLQAYIARAGLPRESWKEHYRSLSAQATDYVDRAQKRKTHKLDGYTGQS